MKVLFAVSNENISETIIKKYQSMYKEIITGKNVYYFNAILKELQKDKTYDRIVISEDLEPFANKNYEMIDNFIFEKLESINTILAIFLVAGTPFSRATAQSDFFIARMSFIPSPVIPTVLPFFFNISTI